MRLTILGNDLASSLGRTDSSIDASRAWPHAGCDIHSSLHLLQRTVKTTRIGPAREGITSRSALPGSPDFVAAASRERHGLHQRKPVDLPGNRIQRRHRFRLAGIAQQGHVRHEGLRVEADLRFHQCAAQLGNERVEFGRNHRGARPGDAVAFPVARLVEDKRNAARRNLPRGALDLRHARIRDAAEKSQSHVQILGTRRPAAAQRVELARPALEPRAHLVVGPQCEEQPHGNRGQTTVSEPEETMKTVVCPRFYSSRAIASAAMPSPRPIAPSRSAVLALMFTWPRSISRSAARFATIAAVCGAIFGACAMMVASRLTMENPARRTFLPTSRRNARLFA